jgi:hypothetical protein
MWDVANLNCRRTCTALSSDQYPELAWSQVRDYCFNDIMCEVPKATNTTCRMKCQYLYDTETACTNDDECVWDQTRSRCATHCTYLLGRTTCSSNPMCSFNDNTDKCRLQCRFRYNSKDACEALNTNCSWSATEKVCISDCKPLGTATKCNANDLCYWDGTGSECLKLLRRIPQR